jgi:hypothetical protein
MIHLVRTRRPRTVRRAVTARAGDAAYNLERDALQRKDFSVVPVCGSVRPSASQRSQGVTRVG